MDGPRVRDRPADLRTDPFDEQRIRDRLVGMADLVDPPFATLREIAGAPDDVRGDPPGAGKSLLANQRPPARSAARIEQEGCQGADADADREGPERERVFPANDDHEILPAKSQPNDVDSGARRT